MTMVGTTEHGVVSILVPTSGIPALRLLQWHAPTFEVKCTDAKGSMLMLPLSALDISLETIPKLNAMRISYTPAKTTGAYPVAPVALAR